MNVIDFFKHALSSGTVKECRKCVLKYLIFLVVCEPGAPQFSDQPKTNANHIIELVLHTFLKSAGVWIEKDVAVDMEDFDVDERMLASALQILLASHMIKDHDAIVSTFEQHAIYAADLEVPEDCTEQLAALCESGDIDSDTGCDMILTWVPRKTLHYVCNLALSVEKAPASNEELAERNRALHTEVSKLKIMVRVSPSSCVRVCPRGLREGVPTSDSCADRRVDSERRQRYCTFP